MSAPAPEKVAPLWRNVGEVPTTFGPCVVTLGVFDGLHRGHARLVERALEVGRAQQLPTVLVTFDPHPARVLGLPRDTGQLSTVERRAELARRLGVDAICVLPFTREFAKLSPDDFVEHVLVEALHAQEIVIGANFTFGHRAAGSVDTLRELGVRHGFATHSVGLLQEAGTRCSSTAVRDCLRRGDVLAAARVLGRPHSVEGTLQSVVGGECELHAAGGTALPSPGSYFGKLAGIGLVTLRVTSDRRLIIESAPGASGFGSVEFIDRKGRR
jgi:riboflavin kinase/FMN adenylyltransferase